MKSKNLFAKTFIVTTFLSFGFLALASYSSKKALAADPELLNRLESKYNVRITGFGVSPSRQITKDSWNFSGPFQNVAIKTIDGDLRIIAVDGNELSIEVEGRLPENAQPEQRLLKITTEENAITIADSDNVSKLKILVKVPKNLLNLSVDTISGDVSMKNVSAKDFKFKSISADLHAENSKFENTSGKTVSGDVEIQNLQEGTVKIESISGDLELKLPSNAKADFKLHSLSGKITNPYGSAHGSAAISLSTTSGDIEIE